ncbi:MAG: SGNH/GDSL hydrolase family protein [Candidatus Microsaccharimonas sp.]
MCVALVKFVFIILWSVLSVTFLFSSNTLAEPQGWVGADIHNREVGPGRSFLSGEVPCAGVEKYIDIGAYYRGVTGCVFGDEVSVRIARYKNDVDVFEYAVAFPYEQRFSRVEELCHNKAGCSYAPRTNAFLMQTLVSPGVQGILLYDHFVEHLKQQFTPEGERYYKFTPDGNMLLVATPDGPLAANAARFSDNGEWAVVELKTQGIVRIHVDTQAMLRIDPLGLLYDIGKDPIVEFTISNDGQWVVVTGKNAGLDVIKVAENCGDELVRNLKTGYYNGYKACPTRSLDARLILSGYSMASAPTFSEDGSLLSVTVTTTNGKKRVVFSPNQELIENQDVYVAMGDSFTSGEGETDKGRYLDHTDNANNQCHVSNRSYPFLLGLKWGVTSYNLACSGAVISDTTSDKGESQFSTLLQLEPNIISIGIGGNDAGLMTKLKACLGISTCEWAKDGANRKAIAREIESIASKLMALVESIKTEVPSAKIVLVGYPKVINEDGNASCGIPLNSLLDSKERFFMDQAIQHLNKVVDAVAGVTGVNYVGVEDALYGERLCEGGSKAMNAIRIGDTIAPITFLPKVKVIGAESFHPTPFGHTMMAAAITDRFATKASLVNSCQNCRGHVPQIQASSYWTSSDDQSDKEQFVALKMLEKVSYKLGETVGIKISQLFKPGTNVKAEIHSTPTEIALYTADEKGSVDQSFQIPNDFAPGYHTVHLKGVARDGYPLNAYSLVWIEGDGSNQQDIKVETTQDEHISIAYPASTKEPSTQPADTNILTSSQYNIASVLTTPNYDVLGKSHDIQTLRGMAGGENNINDIPKESSKANAWPLIGYVLGVGVIVVLIYRIIRKSL